MKKSLYNYFSFSVYKYAPESFRLFFNSKEVILSDYNQKSNFGYIAITKGKEELLKAIKKWVRNETRFSKKQRNLLQAIPITNSSDYVHIRYFVNPNDIISRLQGYKFLKEALEMSQYKNPITIKIAQLNADYKINKVTEETETLQLSNRIKYIA